MGTVVRSHYSKPADCNNRSADQHFDGLRNKDAGAWIRIAAHVSKRLRVTPFHKILLGPFYFVRHLRHLLPLLRAPREAICIGKL